MLEPRGFAHRSRARKWFRQSYGTHVPPRGGGGGGQQHQQGGGGGSGFDNLTAHMSPLTLSAVCIFETFGKHCSKIKE